MMSTNRFGNPGAVCAGAPLAANMPERSAARMSSGRLVLERRIGNSVIRPGDDLRDRRERLVAVHVTGAAAIAQLARGVAQAVRRLRMQVRLEVLGMAGAAGADICRRGVRHR